MEITENKRNEDMKLMRNGGATLLDIALKYGITPARVMQIVGVKSGTKRKQTAQKIRTLISTFYAQYGIYPTIGTLSDMSGKSSSYVRLLLQMLREEGCVTLEYIGGRTYISGVVPSDEITPDMRAQVLERLAKTRKEWK